MSTYHEAKLLATASNQSEWPSRGLPEIIFVGRSNAGKSSLINTLCGRKNLAYSGKTPGKTRLLNFFEIDGKVVFTDAPGYGYATSDEKSAIRFDRLISPYFRNRKQLAGMVMIMDIRRVPNDDDLTMIDYGRANHIPILVVCTKADKLSRGRGIDSMRKIASVLHVPMQNMIAASSLKKQGIDEIWKALDEMAAKHS